MKVLTILEKGDSLRDVMTDFMMYKRVEFMECHDDLIKKFEEEKEKRGFKGTIQDLFKNTDSFEMKDGKYGMWFNPNGCFRQFGLDHFKKYFGETYSVDSTFDFQKWLVEMEQKFMEHYDLVEELFDGIIPELEKTRKQIVEELRNGNPDIDPDEAEVNKLYYGQKAFERMKDFQNNLVKKNLNMVAFEMETFQMSKLDYVKFRIADLLTFDHIIKKVEGKYELAKGAVDLSKIQENEIYCVVWVD